MIAALNRATKATILNKVNRVDKVVKVVKAGQVVVIPGTRDNKPGTNRVNKATCPIVIASKVSKVICPTVTVSRDSKKKLRQIGTLRLMMMNRTRSNPKTKVQTGTRTPTAA